MIRYFKINDPYRLLTLFLFIVATRTAVIIIGFRSNFSTYYSLSPDSEQLGTLYLWITELLQFAFGASLIPSIVLSSLLVFVQAFSLNSILIRNKALTQNTYLPAAIYILILSASPEFMLLSPALFAVTFIMIGLNYMFFHLQYRGTEENILSTGVVFGLASLFDPSSAVFILLLFTVYIFFSSTLNRRYFLLLFGVFFPYLLIWLFYLWKGESQEFWFHVSNNLFITDSEFLIPINQLLIVVSLPLLISAISVSQTLMGIGLTVHQIIIQKTFLILGFFSIVSMTISDEITSTALIYLAPTLAFFVAQFLLTRKRKRMPEVVFLILLIWGLAFLFLPILAPNILPISYDGLLK